MCVLARVCLCACAYVRVCICLPFFFLFIHSLDPPPDVIQLSLAEINPKSVKITYKLSQTCVDEIHNLNSCAYILFKLYSAGVLISTTNTSNLAADVTQTIAGLKPSTHYRLEVSTYSERLERSGSARNISFETVKHSISLANPNKVIARVLNTSAIYVEWQHVKVPGVQLTGYMVRYREQDHKQSFSNSVIRVPVTYNWVVINGLSFGILYKIRVHSFIESPQTGYHDSIASAEVPVRLPPFTVFTRILNATAVQVVSSQLSQDVRRLKVTARPERKGQKNRRAFIDTTQYKSTIITDLQPDTIYRLKVTAMRIINNRFEDIPGGQVKVQPLTTPPLPSLSSSNIIITTSVRNQQGSANVKFNLPPATAETGSLKEIRVAITRQVRNPKDIWNVYNGSVRQKTYTLDLGEFYQLSARALYARSGWTNTNMQNINIHLPVPPLASDPAVVLISPTSVNVTWRRLSAIFPVQGYNVSFRLDGEDVWEYVYETLNARRNVTTIENLIEGARYHFRVEVFAKNFRSSARAAVADLLQVHLAPQPVQMTVDYLADEMGVRIGWRKPAPSKVKTLARRTFNIDYANAFAGFEAQNWKTIPVPADRTHHVIRSIKKDGGSLLPGFPYLMRMRAEYGTDSVRNYTVGSHPTSPLKTVYMAPDDCCNIFLDNVRQRLNVVRQLHVMTEPLSADLSEITIRWYPPARQNTSAHIVSYKVYYKISDLHQSPKSVLFSTVTATYPAREIKMQVRRSRGNQIVSVRMNAVNEKGDGKLSDVVFGALQGSHATSSITPTYPARTTVRTVEEATTASSVASDEPLLQTIIIAGCIAAFIILVTCVIIFIVIKRVNTSFVARGNAGNEKRQIHTSRQLHASTASISHTQTQKNVYQQQPPHRHQSPYSTHLTTSHNASQTLFPFEGPIQHNQLSSLSWQQQQQQPQQPQQPQQGHVTSRTASSVATGTLSMSSVGSGKVTARASPEPAQSESGGFTTPRPSTPCLSYQRKRLKKSMSLTSGERSLATDSLGDITSIEASLHLQDADPIGMLNADSSLGKANRRSNKQADISEQEVQYDDLHHQLEQQLPHLVAFPSASNSDFSSTTFDDSSQEPTPVKRAKKTISSPHRKISEEESSTHREEDDHHIRYTPDDRRIGITASATLASDTVVVARYHDETAGDADGRLENRSSSRQSRFSVTGIPVEPGEVVC